MQPGGPAAVLGHDIDETHPEVQCKTSWDFSANGSSWAVDLLERPGVHCGLICVQVIAWWLRWAGVSRSAKSPRLLVHTEEVRNTKK
eukprot:3666766-Amphidinium_carterae.1